MSSFEGRRCKTVIYFLVISVEVLVILYSWSPRINSTHYKRLSSQETHADELFSHEPNVHYRTGLHELGNATNYGTPSGTVSTHYKRLSSQETHADELFSHEPNVHYRTGLYELGNATNYGTPSGTGDKSHQFVNFTDIVKNLTSPVLLTATNYGYLDLLLNLLSSIQRIPMQPTILVVCEDKTVYVELQKWQINLTLKFQVALTHLQESVTNAAKYDTPSYKSLVQKRVSYIEFLIQSGLDVLYIDSDVVLLENPFKYFNGKQYDVFAQTDVEGKRVACSGFFYMRANNKTKKFVTTWRRGLVRDTWGNQFAFNRKLKLFQPRMRVNILPSDLFMSGKIFLKSEKPWFERTPRPVEVHVNYMVGGEDKVDLFKLHELWFVKDLS